MGIEPRAMPRPRSRRERYRQQTLLEIREAARAQIEDNGGAGALSLKALAKELGMAGPSLYRYVASRDELLTEVLTEAYDELAAAVEGAAGGPETTPADRLRAYARAYREWALARPAFYELLFGTPVPGYVAPAEATGPAARRSLAALVAVVAALRGNDPAEARVRATVFARSDPDDEPFVLAVQTWARIHGLVSLELRGHLQHLVASPAALYEAEVDLALTLIAS